MRWLMRAAAGSGERGRLTVLIFHRVTPHRDELFPMEMDRERFEQVCAWLSRWFSVFPLDEAVRRLRAGNLPAGSMSITFDDGYADNHSIAMPILRRHGLCATFFVATGFLDGGRMWNDTVIESLRRAPPGRLDLSALGLEGMDAVEIGDPSSRCVAIHRILAAVKYLEPELRRQRVEALGQLCRAELPTDLMMTSQQVRELHRAGMQVGGHTVLHPILATLDDAQAQSEIMEGRRHLEEIIGSQVSLFAYPNGRPGTDYGPRDVALVRACGFEAAVSTAPHAARMASDPHEIPRFTPWKRSRWAFAGQLVRNLLIA